MSKKKIDDGFAPNLVEGAIFVGKYQFPKLQQHVDLIIPEELIPFDKRHLEEIKNQAIHFYIHDIKFRKIIFRTEMYINELKRCKCVISPDCSLYRDMPLCLQIINTYFNRAVAYCLESNGIYVIPNVRWGDKRSFEFCFDGLPKNDIVCISTYGCIRGKENKYYFKMGLREMLRVLMPKIVLVYGAMPIDVFEEFKEKTTFVHYDNYLSKKLGGNK